MNECILVVDDDREIVGAIAIVLEREGYTVRRAYDGLGAVEQALDPAVRLILIDVMMPKLDGLSALMRERYTSLARISFLASVSAEIASLTSFACFSLSPAIFLSNS